jgi:GDPmannose 4,6-dehydratase
VAKVAAHQAVGLYRDAYNLFGCCGILFNHESPRRGENFVTRKITKYVAYLYHELRQGNPTPHKLGLGSLATRRDWGHAADYVRAMHLMLQQDRPDDYIVATGESHSVRELCELAFGYIGANYQEWVYADPQFMRPAEVPHLEGCADKARRVLGWEPQVTFKELVEDMVRSDINQLRGCCK